MRARGLSALLRAHPPRRHLVFADLNRSLSAPVLGDKQLGISVKTFRSSTKGFRLVIVGLITRTSSVKGVHIYSLATCVGAIAIDVVMVLLRGILPYRIIDVFQSGNVVGEKCGGLTDQKQPGSNCVLRTTRRHVPGIHKSREYPASQQRQRPGGGVLGGARDAITLFSLTLRCVLMANCWNDLELANRFVIISLAKWLTIRMRN